MIVLLLVIFPAEVTSQLPNINLDQSPVTGKNPSEVFLTSYSKTVKNHPINQSLSFCQVSSSNVEGYREDVIRTMQNIEESFGFKISANETTCNQMTRIAIRFYETFKNLIDQNLKNDSLVLMVDKFGKCFTQINLSRTARFTKADNDDIEAYSDPEYVSILQNSINYVREAFLKKLNDVKSYILKRCETVKHGERIFPRCSKTMAVIADDNVYAGVFEYIIRCYGDVYRSYWFTKSISTLLHNVSWVPFCNSKYPVEVKVLYQMQKELGALSADNTFRFFTDLNGCSTSSAVTRLLKQDIDKAIMEWATAIIREDTDEIINHTTPECGHHVDTFWPQIIEKALNVSGGFKGLEVLEFIIKLPCTTQRLKAFPPLFQFVLGFNAQQNRLWIPLTYWLKKEMDYVYANGKDDLQFGPGGYKAYLNEYRTLKYSLPIFVRKVIWCGEKCTIRNKRYKNYMYAAAYHLRIDNYKGSVFTWKSGELADECYWSISMNKGGKTFTIKNTYTNSYLHYNHDFKNEKKLGPQRVFYSIHGERESTANWVLLPLDDSTYEIKDVTGTVSLYASSEMLDKNRRLVGTGDIHEGKRYSLKLEKSIKEEVSISPKWEINCFC